MWNAISFWLGAIKGNILVPLTFVLFLLLVTLQCLFDSSSPVASDRATRKHFIRIFMRLVLSRFSQNLIQKLLQRSRMNCAGKQSNSDNAKDYKQVFSVATLQYCIFFCPISYLFRPMRQRNSKSRYERDSISVHLPVPLSHQITK